MELKVKPCQSCKETKTLDQFWKKKNSLDGREAKCTECRKKEQRHYYRTTIKVKREILKKYPPQETYFDTEERSEIDLFNNFLDSEAINKE